MKTQQQLHEELASVLKGQWCVLRGDTISLDGRYNAFQLRQLADILEQRPPGAFIEVEKNPDFDDDLDDEEFDDLDGDEFDDLEELLE